MQDAIQQLTDRNEIIDVTLRYGMAVDTRDWDLFESLFTDPVEVNVTFLGRGFRRLASGEWASSVRDNVSGYESTQHIITNHLVSLTGDTATCRSCFIARHYLPNDTGDPFRDIGGTYDWELARIDQSWKIMRYKLTLAWSEGNAALRDIARERYLRTRGGS